MGTLRFICPERGLEVNTGIDRELCALDIPRRPLSFALIAAEPHLLGMVAAWVEGEDEDD